MRSKSKESVGENALPHVYLSNNENSQKVERLVVLSGMDVKIIKEASRSIHLPAIVAEGKVLRKLREIEDFIEQNRETFKID